MKSVYVYQIIDSVSEGVISTFIGPNDVFASRQFEKFLNDPKLKDNIVKEDFILVKPTLSGCFIFDDYTDYCSEDPSGDVYIVRVGGDVVADSDDIPVEEKF